jgi:hypothetical protein
VWDLPHAQERLKLYEDNIPELNRIRGQLTKQIEIKLGRAMLRPFTCGKPTFGRPRGDAIDGRRIRWE